MSATYGTVLHDVEPLDRQEQYHLFAWLRKRFSAVAEAGQEKDEAETAEVEAAWDAELAKRIDDIKSGRVELISAEESEKRLGIIFAKHGIPRQVKDLA